MIFLLWGGMVHHKQLMKRENIWLISVKVQNISSRKPKHNNDVPFVVTPNCLKEDSCLVYVICVCFCIVVCFFLCLSSFCVLCIQCCQFLWIANFFECPFGVLQLLFIVSTCPFASGIHYKNPGSFSRKCRFEYNEIVDIQCSEHDVFQG